MLCSSRSMPPTAVCRTWHTSFSRPTCKGPGRSKCGRATQRPGSGSFEAGPCRHCGLCFQPHDVGPDPQRENQASSILAICRPFRCSVPLWTASLPPGGEAEQKASLLDSCFTAPGDHLGASTRLLQARGLKNRFRKMF